MKPFNTQYLLKITKILITSFCIFSILSCGEDEVDPSIRQVEDFLTPEAVKALEDLGFDVFPGDNPPLIEGTYLAEHVLRNTSVPDDPSVPGDRFDDVTITFSDQSGSSITVETDEPTASGRGEGSLIIGDGGIGQTSNFSVFVKQELVDDKGVRFTATVAISGDMFLDQDGRPFRFLEYQMAILMIDNGGNPNGDLLPNNTGRLFEAEGGSASLIQ